MSDAASNATPSDFIRDIVAQHVAEGADIPMFERWNLRRFKEGRLLSESMIIG